MTTALQTTEYLNLERDYIPWEAASVELAFVKGMLIRHPSYGSYKVTIDSIQPYLGRHLRVGY